MKNPPTVTALVTAYARAYHALHDKQKIFNDTLIPELFSEEEKKNFGIHLAAQLALIAPEEAAKNPDPGTALALVMQHHTASITLSRSRFTEEALLESINTGVTQYVLLGAGLDTFAFRHAELEDRIQIFEIDHPATHTMKIERIKKAGWKIPDNLHFVPVNFNEEDFAEKLLHAGFQTTEKSFFSFLGVSYYLPQKTLDTTFSLFHTLTPQESLFSLDILETEAFQDTTTNKKVALMKVLVERVGEPMITGFDIQTLEENFKEFELRLHTHLSPTLIEKTYFAHRKDEYHAYPQIHFLLLKNT